MIRSVYFWVGAIFVAFIPLFFIDILQHSLDWQKEVREEIIAVAYDVFKKSEKKEILDRLLERNQSLSSGYLEELSRRFKKQSEELSATHEIFRKTLNESLSKCKNVEESLRFHISRLSRNNENLRELITKVELQRGGMVFFALVQLVCTLLFWWRSRRPAGCEWAERRLLLRKHPPESNVARLCLVNTRRRSCARLVTARSRSSNCRTWSTECRSRITLSSTPWRWFVRRASANRACRSLSATGCRGGPVPAPCST